MNTRAAIQTRVSVLPVLIALLFNILLIAPASIGGTVLATHTDGPLVDPIEFPGSDNKTCGQLDDDIGQTWDFEFKINQGSPNGTFEQGDPGVEVTPNVPTDFSVTMSTTNDTLTWSSNLPVLGVFVKGGPVGGNLYNYSALDFPVTHDNGLTVMAADDGQLFGISHVSFCFDEVPRLPRLSIEKSPDGTTVNAGDPISFTITVTNSAQATAAALNVDIDDDLPAGFAWTDNKAECSIDLSSHLHCDIASLAIGASFSVTVSAPTDGSICGVIPNVAFADADGVDQISNPGSVTITCAVIRIEKTPDGGSVTAGDAATFAMTVYNDGDGAATGVTLFDDLPGIGWTIVAAQTTLTTCAISSAVHPTLGSIGEWLSCGPDTVLPGAANAKKATVTRLAMAADCPTINNEASVDTTNDDQDSDTGMIGVLCAQIGVDKTPDNGFVDAPGTATFSIVTTNSGNGNAVGTTLFDDLPEVAGGWDVMANPGGATAWASCTIFDTDHPTLGDIGEWLSCGPETIAASPGPGNTRTVTVSASVTTADCGAVPNNASVATSNDGTDNDGGLITVRCPDLSIEKSTTTPEVNAGDAVSYTVSLPNGGNGSANDVVITDVLPLGIAWSEASDECSIALGTLTCGPLDIPAGQTFSVTLTGTTDEGECPSISNAASFTSSNAGSGSTNEVPTVIIVNCPDLEVEKGGSGVVVAGDEVQFTITVTNNGAGDAYDVVLADNLPALGSGTWAVTAVDGIGLDDCVIASDVLTCSLDVLASGADFSVTVSATSDPDDCPSLTNDASVEASNEPTDTETQADNSDSHAITVNCPDTSIEKDATTPVVNAGDEATFTITVTAGGTGTNQDVTLTDNLIGDNDDWSFAVSGAGSDADCSISESEVLFCDFGDLAPPATVTIVLTYQTDAGDCPSITNSASVSALADTNTSNNASGEVTINVNCPDVTVDKEPVATPISAGEQGQFTIEVTNDGPGTAYDVEVIDHPEEGTVWTVLDDGGFECDSVVGGDQQALSCTLAELAAEASATILIGYTTSQNDCPSVDNAVTVTASNEPQENTENNSDTATIVVECPGLNLLKEADADPIDAGEQASFTLTVWNLGPGDAFDVELHDDLPAGLQWDFEVVSGDATDSDCRIASSLVFGGVQQMSIGCDFGTVGVTSMANGIVIRVFADTERADCGLLENNASADGSNLDEPLTASDSILVKCAEVAIVKTNNQPNPVLPGTNVTFTLNVTVSDGPAEDVVVVDTLPAGFGAPTAISDGGTYSATTREITWNLGVLADGSFELTYQAAVSAGVAHGSQLVNVAVVTSPNSQCPDLETLEPECEDDSTVIVRVPTLVIDKVANAEVITISGPANAPVATPSVVTWTLSYTLTNGPVTNAVITDVVPAGLVYVDGSASNGGVFTDATDTLTWTFPTLSVSGSVTFQTTVDAATISRTVPTVNVTVIDSNETAPDNGQDGITVTVEPPPLGGTPTPRPSLPNTATGIGIGGEPVTVPVELLVAFFIGSLGVLTLANVKARSRR
jgi:uncharacterized repeat protein (TIGR01451 family)